MDPGFDLLGGVFVQGTVREREPCHGVSRFSTAEELLRRSKFSDLFGRVGRLTGRDEGSSKVIRKLRPRETLMV